MRLENELKKMEEIKLNLEIEIQDLRKDVPVETKVIFFISNSWRFRPFGLLSIFRLFSFHFHLVQC